MKVAFFERHLIERGTTVAVFDYAYYNEKILDNESIIIYLNTQDQDNEFKSIPDVIDKFNKHFKLYSIDNVNDIDNIIKNENCDVLYQLSLTTNCNVRSKICKNVIHTIFDCKNVQPHFHKMATISRDVHNWHKDIPVVPHMINLPKHNDNMRKELNIPDNATVFGRYGGKTEFNLGAVQHSVIRVAKARSDIYFLFVNTNKFLDTKNINFKNIIFLPTIKDEFPQYNKVKFINTCDAMIHARQCGEAFGIAIGEFNIFNKPIITNISRRHNAHISILGKKGIYYPNGWGDKELDKQLPNTPRDLGQILTSFNREEAKKQDWNGYSEYTPEKVITKFNNVFLH